MKKITPLLLTLCLCLNTYGQANSYTLTTPDTESKEYIARDFVRFKPGYSFEAEGTKKLRAAIQGTDDPFSPKYDPSGELTASYSTGGVGSHVNVSPTGAAIHTIPIAVPAGVNGMQPDIAVTYSSQAGNGIVGWGTNISGLSAITRAPKSIYYDGAAKGIGYSADDALMLDGQRLILVSGTAGTEGAVYNTENDPFTTITYKTLSFEVLAKDGTKYTYLINIANLLANIKTNAWYLKEVTDVFGNYINYTYENDGYYVYPKTISYGNNRNVENPLNNTVSFTYENRPDVTTFKIETANVNIRQRLKSITTQTGDNIYREYTFAYKNNDHFSRLVAVTEKNGAGEELHPVHLKWNYLPAFAQTAKTPEFPSSVDYTNVEINTTGDINGDGLEDLITLTYSGDKKSIYALAYYAFKNAAGEVAFTKNANNPFWVGDINIDIWKNVLGRESYQALHSGMKGGLLADMNGDGVNELILPSWNIDKYIDQDATFRFYIHNIATGQQSSYYYTVKTAPSFYNGRPMDLVFEPIYTVSDFNNDGKAEILIVETGRTDGNYPCCIISYNTSTGSYEKNTFGITKMKAETLFAADFNGDGMTDIMVDGFNNNEGRSEFVILWNQGGTFSDNNKTAGDTMFKDYMLRMGDFNGDGLPDFLMNKADSDDWYFAMNNGNGTFNTRLACIMPTHNQPFITNYHEKYVCMVYDFDFDGKSDVVYTKAKYERERDCFWCDEYGKNPQTQTYWMRSTGYLLTQVKMVTSSEVPDANPKYHLLGDFDGNGRPELMNYGYNCYNGGDYFKWHIYQNPSLTPSSGMLTHVKDVSRTTTITYDNLTNSAVYTKGSGSTYPVADIHPAFPVVKNITSTNGIANPVAVNYKYEGAKVHWQGKGFLGFGKQTVENTLTGMKTETGITSLHATYAAPTETYTKTTLGGKTAQATTKYTYANKGGKRYFAYPNNLTERDFDGNTTTSTFAYNSATGNITQERAANDDGYRQVNYSEYVQAGGTVANKPRRITVTQKHSDDAQTFTSSTYFTYNAAYGYPTQKIENYGTSLALTTDYLSYDNLGNLTSYRVSGSGIGAMTYNTAYDRTGRFIKQATTVPATTTATYTYNAWGSLITERDETNPAAVLITTHTYDGWGRETATAFADGRKATYTTGKGGSVDKRYFTLTETTGQPWVRTWYDDVGRETFTETTGPKGMEIRAANTYNGKGQLIRTENRQGNLTMVDEFSYDAFGRVVSELIGGRKMINYTYGNRRVTSKVEVTEQTHTKTFDAWGNVKTATDPGGTVAYTYYSGGKPKEITAAGATTTMRYDAAGNQIELTDPNAGTTTYEYNALGQLTKQTDANGNVTVNRYDGLNRLLRSTLNGVNTDYTYGTSGFDNLLLTGIQQGSYGITYRHDRLGRVTRETRSIDGSPMEVEYLYDAKTGQPSGRFYSQTGGFSGNSYDAYGYLERVNTDSEIVWQRTGNTGTQATAKLANGAIETSKSYDAYGFLSEIKTMRGNTTLHNMEYFFNRTTENLVIRRGMQRDNTEESFDHDDLDRLINYWVYTSSGTVISGTSFGYSPNGNISYKIDAGMYSYESNKPHAVTSITNQLDEVSHETQQIIYTAFNKAEKITERIGNDDYELEIVYGPDRQRWKSVLKKNGVIAKEIIFAPGCESVTENGRTRHFYYISGGDGLAAVLVKEEGQPDKVYYAHTDHLGSIVRLTDKDGVEVFSAQYDAWGKQHIWNNTLAFHRGYTGHEMLPQFGLINMNGRIYDPMLGRMLSPDNYVQEPLFSQSYNRYSYCWNNPLRYTDPTGEFITWNISKKGFSIGFNLTLTGAGLA